MRKKKINAESAKLICQFYKNGSSINYIVNNTGITRRIVERSLIENGLKLKTKSEKITDRFPILKNRDALVDLYYNKAMSLDEIAFEIGTNSQVVKTAFTRLSIERLPQNIKRITKNTPDKLRDMEYLQHEYINNKRSVSNIAKQFGVSDTTVRTMLKYYGISRRSHIEQMQLTLLSPEEKLNAKIARRLRSRLSNAVTNGQKAGSAVRDLGSSIEELKKYLESKFTLGMSWDNYGYCGWHIDHIKPLDSFDLSNSEEFKKACHYSNLQPLWANDNFIKSNKAPSSSKIKLYIVCGPCGSGKSWVCNQISDNLKYISYDSVPKEEHYYEFVEAAKAGMDIIYDPLRKPTTIMNRYKDEFDIKLCVIDEDLNTIVSRIKNRNGKPNIQNIKKALNKVPRWKKHASFTGTSSEVLKYLKTKLNI